MKKIFSIILTSIAMSSCVDTLILPDNKTVDEDFWQKKSEVQAVVTAAYAQLRDETAMRNFIVWGDFRSDELVLSTDLPLSAKYKVDLSQFYTFNLEPENEFTKWYPFYSAINYCNLVLERAKGVMAIDPDYMQGDYESNRSQMLALRAYCYFYLMRVFHDIPVTPHAYLKSGDDLTVPQVAPAEVIEMCIRDLEEAADGAVAGDTYTEKWRNRGFFTKDGINALLADIYLWRASVNRDAADYQACVDYCDKVIDAKKLAYENGQHERKWGSNEEKMYYLADYNEGDNVYSDLFGTNGQNAEESIFELQFSTVTNTGLDQMYFRYNNAKANSTGYLRAHKTYGAVDARSTGPRQWTNATDQRLFDNVYKANAENTEHFDIRKFVATSGLSELLSAQSSRDSRENVRQNWIVYRLTDVMLMKAEALVQLYVLGGKDPQDTRNREAFDICKAVNDRSQTNTSNGLNYSTYQSDMEMLVLAERARELCFEGKRWFDLMRYNYRHTTEQADLTKKLTESYVTNSEEFLSMALRKYLVPDVMKAKIRDERYLYMPINQDEVELNPLLEQNPVYKSKSKK